MTSTSERLRPDQEQRVRDASDGGWTYDGRAQPYVSDLRAVLGELDHYRDIVEKG